MDLIAAHDHCRNHRAELNASQICGCFYCCATYQAQAIQEWTDNDQTAICPECGIDAVLGSASGFPVTGELLAAMHKRWF